jgi:Cytochrome c7 and related cytochrome c
MMRFRPNQAVAILAFAGALGWWFTRTAWPAPWQLAGVQSGQSGTEDRSLFFTPAHASDWDALRDFFGVRPAPVQPIAYTHKVHLANGMQCVQCHVGVDTGPDAQLPSVKVCMMCHQAIATDKPEIQKLAAYYRRGEDIPWQRVYDYPREAHVKFNHAPHLRADVECKVCHGDMAQQTVAVRSVDLTMGYCVDCHKTKGASIDCNTCHF